MSSIEKRSHILEVAERLFAYKGFDGTSVRDIAESAGVNISMISYYFGSKEGLMQALFEERTGHILPKLELLVKNESLTPVQKIEILIDDYVQRAHKKVLFYKILIGEQMMEKNTTISDLIKELRKKNTELLEILIGEGQEKGVFKKDADIIFMTNTLIGTVTQTFINLNHYRSYNHLEQLDDETFQQQLKNKLSSYIKDLFKSILSYEV